MPCCVRARFLAMATAVLLLPACKSDSATSVPTPGARVKVSGDQQIGNRGSALPIPIRVRATDSAGTPLKGVTVTFSATSGGGSVTPPSMVTNDSGLASTTWILGSASTDQTLSAIVGGLPPLIFKASGVPSSGSGFQITLVNVGPPFSPAVQIAFDSAIAMWQRVITGDIPDYPNHTIDANSCNNPTAYGPINVDDVLILARFDSIDGPSNILGQASPCWIRDTGFLTISGTMRFDTADVAGLVSAGALNAVILHEMAHVLGYGTLWAPSLINCLQNPSTSANHIDTFFSCSQGRAAFDAIGGTTYTGGSKVPIENCTGLPPSVAATCGAGTFNSHWRESVFGPELMTGYLNSGAANPLSRLTIGAMEDLGYTVNYSVAQTYVRTFTAAPMTAGATQKVIDLRGDVPRQPIYIVDRNNRITGVARP